MKTTVGKLITWLESMKGSYGYYGPISHYWEHSLLYTGPQIDWRYEGIITGYLALYQGTGDGRYLRLAKEAGDFILHAQLPNGCYLNSSFQHGALEGNTPHEAAVDCALLYLAQTLRKEKKEYRPYVHAALRNIKEHYIGRLWTGKGFADTVYNPVLVANKNATAAEALHLVSSFVRIHPRYQERAIEVALHNQVTRGPTLGATIHKGTPEHLRIGIYTARCASALARIDSERYQPFIDNAWEFLRQLVGTKGTLFGMQKDGKIVKEPHWIAPSAEYLGSIDYAKFHGSRAIKARVYDLLANGQLASGGIRTAHTLHGIQRFTDILPVAGWNDKALRYLAPLGIDLLGTERHEERALLAGHEGRYVEDAKKLQFMNRERTVYKYTKGRTFPDIYDI